MTATRSRLTPIDAARGAAMLFAALSHFSWLLSAQDPRGARLLRIAAMVATPTFLIISGAMAGLLHAQATPHTLPRVREGLINRGLFVLVVGHVALSLALYHHLGGFAPALLTIYTTDAIGLAAVVAGLWIERLALAPLLPIAVVLLAVSWLIALLPKPGSEAISSLERVLFDVGPRNDARHLLTGAVVPLLALYVAGMRVGTTLARRIRSGAAPSAAGEFLMLPGVALVVAASLGHALVGTGRAFGINAPEWLRLTVQISLKDPPSPGYLSLFSGLALLLTWGMFRLADFRLTRAAVVERLATIGRASLVVYVAQYFLLATLPYVLGYVPTRVWPFDFAAAVAVLWTIASLWGRMDGNRLLTFRLKLLPPDRDGTRPHEAKF